MTKKVSYILDTDPWYDPDDLFALQYLLNSGITPDLIVTGDEVDGKRAKLTKWFLEQSGNANINVVAGAELPGKTHLFCADLIVGKDYNVSGNVVEEIRKVVDAADQTVYLGVQGLSNLAKFQRVHPELCDKIILYQMGGSLDLNREKAEHNIRIDIPAAKQILELGMKTYLVMLDTTFNMDYEINNEHPLYKFCKEKLPAIAQNVDEFNNANGNQYWTLMHDPLTVSAALGHNFVDFYEAKIKMNNNGMMTVSDEGSKIYLSRPESRAKEFMQHLGEIIKNGN
jgi:inosine-uridine nucleoside N-ribohydrolase